MLFAIDIGNTNMVIGCIDGDKILFSERLSTDQLSRMSWIFTASTAQASRVRSLPL